MRTASMPLNEELRLHDLHSLEILDTPPEKEFDDLVALVAQIFACPIAGIGFLDKERIWFKSAIGLDITEFPRNMSFCAHTLLTNEVVVVSNALHDKRFQD